MAEIPKTPDTAPQITPTPPQGASKPSTPTDSTTPTERGHFDVAALAKDEANHDNISNFINQTRAKLKEGGYGDNDIDKFVMSDQTWLEDAGFKREEISRFNQYRLGKINYQQPSPADPQAMPVDIISPPDGISSLPDPPTGVIGKIYDNVKTAMSAEYVEPQERFDAILHSFDPALDPAAYMAYKLVNGKVLNSFDILATAVSRVNQKDFGQPLIEENFEETFLKVLDYDPKGLTRFIGDTVEFIAAMSTTKSMTGLNPMGLPKSAGLTGKMGVAGALLMPQFAAEGLEKGLNQQDSNIASVGREALVGAATGLGVGAGFELVGAGIGAAGRTKAAQYASNAAKKVWNSAGTKLASYTTDKIVAASDKSLVGIVRGKIGEQLMPFYGREGTYKGRFMRWSGGKALNQSEASSMVKEFNQITKNLDDWSNTPEAQQQMMDVLTGKANVNDYLRLNLVPKELKPWLAEARTAIDARSKEAIDYFRKIGKDDLADAIEQNYGTYLPRKFMEYEEGKIAKLWGWVTGKVKYQGGEFKMRRDKITAWQGSQGIGKFETPEEAVAYIKEQRAAYGKKFGEKMAKKIGLVTAEKNTLIGQTELKGKEKLVDDLFGLATDINVNKDSANTIKKIGDILNIKTTQPEKLNSLVERAQNATRKERSAIIDELFGLWSDAEKVEVKNFQPVIDLLKQKTKHEWAVNWAGKDTAGIKKILAGEQTALGLGGGKKLTVKPPLSEADLAKLGQIKDPRYLVAKAMTESYNDIENLKFLDYVGKKWGVKAPVGLTTKELAQWTKDEGLVLMPDTAAYGTLKGMYAPKNMAKDIKGVFELPSMLEYIYNEYLLAPWKEAKIVWNPATHGRNIMGNLIFADFADIQPWRQENWKYYEQGLKEIMNQKGSVYKNMVKHNLIGTEYYGADIKLIQTELASGSSLPKAISMASQGFQKARAAAGNIYAMEDQIYKSAAYLKYIEQGLTPARAAMEVNKWFPNYKFISPLAKAMRKSPLGVPFLSFTDQATRIALRAGKEHPAKLAKWSAMPGAMTEFSQWYLGMSPQERDVLDTNRSYFEPILPRRDSKGRALTWDARYTFPLANDLAPEASAYGLQLPWLLNNPLVDTAIQTLMGRDVFTGKPITKEDSSLGRRILDHAWATTKTVAPLPSLVTNAPKRIIKAAYDQENSRETLFRAIAGVVVGINVHAPYIVRQKLYTEIRDDMMSDDSERVTDALEKMVIFNETYKTDKQPPITVKGLQESIAAELMKETIKDLE